MKLKLTLLSGVSLLAMTSHAHAFAAIGSAVISVFLGIGAGSLLPVASATAIGLATVGVAATVANVAMQAAFLGRRPSVDPGEIKNTTQGHEGPGRYAFGRVRLAGRLAFGNTSGYNLYRLLLNCFGPVDAVEEYFYDNKSITVDPDGSVTSPPWATPGGSNLFVKFKSGTGSETSWPELRNDFPSLWGSDHRVRGIAQVLLRAVNPGTGSDRFPTLFQGGLKELEVTARVQRPYDPRSGANAWTRNGVIQCLHWARQLPGKSNAMFDMADIGAVANLADQQVSTRGGTAPRCQLSGGWEGPLTHDIVEDMLQSAGLEMVRTAEGNWTFRFLEDWPEPEIVLRSQHIIDVIPQAGPEGAKRPNICRLRYFSPERGFEVSEIGLHDRDPNTGQYVGAAWARVEEEIDRYGEQEYPCDLIFCDDASQAQRIARRLFWMERADFGVLKTKFAGIACWGKRTALIEIPDVGEDGEGILVRARLGTVRVNDDDGTCEIPFKIIPDILATPWNPAVDEVPAPPQLPEFQYESDLPTPAMPSDAAVVQYPDGSYETRVRFSGVNGGTVPEANFRSYSGDNPNPWQSMTEYQGATAWYGWASVDSRGSRADFRVRWFDDDFDGSYFSPLLTRQPMAIDNTPTAAPNVTAQQEIGANTLNVTLGIRVPELRAVKLTVERSDPPLDPSWTTIATIDHVRPDANLSVGLSFPRRPSGDYDVQIRIASYTSNGTRGAYALLTISVPGSD